MPDKPIGVIEAMARNEETVGQLYRAYALKFPEKETLWNELAYDEADHAKWLRGLSHPQGGKEAFGVRERFKPEAIETFYRYLKTELAKVDLPGFTLGQALATALYIEDCLLERKYFEVLSSDSKEFKKVLTDLQSATEKHADNVRAMVLENRKSS